MRITELLSNKGIELGAKVNSKDEAIKILVGLHNKVGNITRTYIDVIWSLYARWDK